jgi:uncharacterized membrane protein YphA (DoxX/SURF4 family)
VVVGVSAAIEGNAYLAGADAAALPTSAAGLLAIVSGASLLIGFRTPAATALAGLSIVAFAVYSIPVPGASLLVDRPGAMCVSGAAAALFLLGPGALSLDARLFGRREIVFPHDSHQLRS